MDISFQGQLKKTELRKAISMAQRPTGGKLVMQLIIWTLVIGLAAYFLISFFTGQAEISPAKILKVAIAIALLIYYIFRPLINPFVVANRLWKEGHFDTPIHGRISGHGISYEISGDKVDLPWKRFSRMRVSDHLISLMTPDAIVTVLPRSFFSSDADWERLKTMLTANILEAK